MLRNLFKVALTIPTTFAPFRQQKIIRGGLSFSFSTGQHHHQSLKKIMSELDAKNVDQVLLKIAELDKSHQEKGLRIIFQKIQDQKLSSVTLVNQNFLNQVSNYPELLIDTHLLHIKILTNYLDELIFREETQSEEVIKSTIEEIVQAFNLCFSAYEKIEKGQKSIKYELKLGKIYTNFFIYHSDRFIKGKERQEGLQKCSLMLRNILALEKNLITQEFRRVEQVQMRELECDDSEKTKLKIITEIKHHTLGLIDLFSENVINLSESIGELARYHRDDKESSEGISESIKNYEAAQEYYNLLGEVKKDSKYYFQIRINKTELVFRLKVSQLKKEEESSKDKFQQYKSEMFKDLDLVYTDAHECLSSLVKNKGPEKIVKEIAMAIMTVRMDQLQRGGQFDIKKVQDSLIEETKNILGKIEEKKQKDSVSKELVTYCKGVIGYLKMLIQQKAKKEEEEKKKTSGQ